MWKWLLGIGTVAGVVTVVYSMKKRPPKNIKSDPDWYQVDREWVTVADKSFWITTLYFHPQKGNLKTFMVMEEPPQGADGIYNPVRAYHERLPWLYNSKYISKVQYDGLRSELKKYYNVTV